MKKVNVLVIFLISGMFSQGAVAGVTQAAVPEPFQGFDANSRLTID